MARTWFLDESEASDRQRSIIRTTSNISFAVTGAAGTGKTLLVLWRAAELESRGEDYLIIVYTRLLKDFIADGAEEVGVDRNKVHYYEEWNFDGQPSADYIIADEVQDFDENMLNNIKNAANQHLIIFGDSAQQIYEDAPFLKGRLFTVEEIASMFSLSLLPPLIDNYRLTKKVARVAKGLLPGDTSFYEHWCVYEGDSKPKLVKCNSKETITKFILNRIEKESLDDVGILVPRKQDVNELVESFTELNSKYEKKVGFGNQASDIDFNSTLPKIMTIHSSKGLQFEAVFLPDFYFQNDNHVWKRVKYVALTRTYKHVYILYRGNNPFEGVIGKDQFDFMDGERFTDFSKKTTLLSGLKKSVSFNNSDMDNIDDDLPF